jgi:ADP-dependent NAD(P)H-hydrate dehydratase
VTVNVVTPNLLREWTLPQLGESKNHRGRVLVVGGPRKNPGGAMLAGLAAMRAGAGVLALAVAESVAVTLAVALPEAGVVGLPEDSKGSLTGRGLDRLDQTLQSTDAVLIGPGLDEPDGTRKLLLELVAKLSTELPVVLDAFALGVLRDVWPDLREQLSGRLVITPNDSEAALLLDRDEAEADLDTARALADRYQAVVCLQDWLTEPGGRTWMRSSGYGGLGTSGSGDVLAGVATGLLARGAELSQAACWASHLHATAADRLAHEIGPVGFLARDLVARLPGLIAELSAR